MEVSETTTTAVECGLEREVDLSDPIKDSSMISFMLESTSVGLTGAIAAGKAAAVGGSMAMGTAGLLLLSPVIPVEGMSLFTSIRSWPSFTFHHLFLALSHVAHYP